MKGLLSLARYVLAILELVIFLLMAALAIAALPDLGKWLAFLLG